VATILNKHLLLLLHDCSRISMTFLIRSYVSLFLFASLIDILACHPKLTFSGICLPTGFLFNYS